MKTLLELNHDLILKLEHYAQRIETYIFTLSKKLF